MTVKSKKPVSKKTISPKEFEAYKKAHMKYHKEEGKIDVQNGKKLIKKAAKRLKSY